MGKAFSILLSILILILALSCHPTSVPSVTFTLTVRVETPQPGPSPSPVKLTPEAVLTPDPYVEKRKQMVESQIRARGVKDERVLAVMEKVPRHEFVPPEYLSQAYADHPLPIGYGQTISQPYIVAVMTELLRLKPGDKVLEIGTGSGYQAAILAEITDKVYTVEIIPELARSAEERLRRLGYTQVKVKNADGYYGWEEYAPYDAIIVTCAPDHVPRPLIRQLKDGGRLVIPVGPPGGYQSLWLIEKHGEEIKSRNVMGVLFVPMLGEH
ncbi:MAG: protein-L-isoaspartate O-methyltransferase [Chloroflexi bacterium]|nr:MAG: protein-L-isoaspartate O-methyltransferase [Chloroflexota bacterium]